MTLRRPTCGPYVQLLRTPCDAMPRMPAIVGKTLLQTVHMGIAADN